MFTQAEDPLRSPILLAMAALRLLGGVVGLLELLPLLNGASMSLPEALVNLLHLALLLAAIVGMSSCCAGWTWTRSNLNRTTTQFTDQITCNRFGPVGRCSLLPAPCSLRRERDAALVDQVVREARPVRPHRIRAQCVRKYWSVTKSEGQANKHQSIG